MKLAKIDNEARQYVLSDGLSIGFDVIELRARAMAREVINRAQGQTVHFATWLECLDNVESNPKGSQDHFDVCNNIHEYAQINASVFGPLTSGLHAKLQEFEGRRIEASVDGQKRRFKVGRTGGWFPSHMELRTKRSTKGDSINPSAKISGIRVILD